MSKVADKVSCPICKSVIGVKCFGPGIANGGDHKARRDAYRNGLDHSADHTTLAQSKTKKALSYKVDFTIGEKRALVDFIKHTKVIDVPECIDIVNLRRALKKLQA